MNYSTCISLLLAGAAMIASAAPPTAVTTIALGPQPPFQSALRITANPGTNRIYVLNSNLPGLAPVGPSIAVVNSASASLVGFLQPAGINAANLVGVTDTRNGVKGYAVNPATNRVYAAYASSSGSTLVAIDSTTDSIAATVPVAGTIASIAVNPSTNKLYAIANGNTDFVRRQLAVFSCRSRPLRTSKTVRW